MPSAKHIQRFEEAFASPAPVKALCDLARALRDEGVSQIDCYFLYSHFLEKTPDDHPAYEAIPDTMDEIYGGPWAKGGGFYTSVLTNEIIEAHRRKAQSQL
jgi:hypothetical protein